eukprot:TRINITY_DN38710_c0_g1_i1.p1 TRINITY_DN38710_c0_g1~~TRINITY_DN38710_c0_g1_i1.p1  ORF type:complete len:282 (-),score=86.16 TRINITY_DN38710_c0_g1_i1:378-1223(-)
MAARQRGVQRSLVVGVFASVAARCGVLAAEADLADEVDLDFLTEEQAARILTAADKDGDGRVSLAEMDRLSVEMRHAVARRDIHAVVQEIDADKDGKLSLEEFLKDMETWVREPGDNEALKQERLDMEVAKFKAADTNGDGFLEGDEMPGVFFPEINDGVLELVTKTTLSEKDINKDGKLTPKEFWEGDVATDQDLSISDEEHADFRRLDTNQDGFIDLDELKVWESGVFHTQEAMARLFIIADKDKDQHITLQEMTDAKEEIGGSDAQYHLMEWAEQLEL